MKVEIITLFPRFFEGIFDHSMLKRAVDAGVLEIKLHNLRDYADDKHHLVDDYRFGGGPGMVLMCGPVFAAVEHVREQASPPGKVILLSPQGRLLTQRIARELSKHPRIALICGRYEGVDERVRQYLATDELSIGDYVLSGGEIAAMVVVDVVTRLLPGVLGEPGATFEDSHAMGLLEYPQYTRPPEFRGYTVPEVLLSGNHAEIVRWRRQESLRRTWQRRPDLLEKAPLSEADRAFLRRLEET